MATALACAGTASARPAPEDTAPLRFRTPAAEQQAQAQSDPWLNRWWTAFDDPLLTRLVEAGITSDPDLAANAEQQSAKRLSGKRGQRAAAALFRAAIYDQGQRKAAKVERIARAYFRARATQRRIAVTSDSLASQQDNIRTAALRFRAGLAPAYDANFARTQSATTSAALGEAEAELQRDLARLGELTRIETQALREAFGTHLPKQTIPALPPEDQNGMLALRRADLLALEQRLAASLIGEGAGQAEIDAALAGQAAAVSPAAARAVSEYTNAISAAGDDVAVALETAQTAHTRVQTLERAVESARVALGDTRMAYNSGLDRFVSVYVAESALLDVRQALIAAQRTEAEAMAGYFTALGGGWQIETAVTVKPADPAADGHE